MVNWSQHFKQLNEGNLVTFGAELVQTKYVKLNAHQAAEALSIAYQRVTGKKPDALVLGFMLAQTGLETGQWKLPGNNWGGVKFSASRDKFFQYLACGEVDPSTGIETRYPAGDPHCIFAAYATPADGAEHYVRTLKGKNHWWNGLHSGSLSEFVNGLQGVKGQFYMTANPKTYQNGLQNMLNQFQNVADIYAPKRAWGQIVLGVLLPSAIVGSLFGYRAVKANPRIKGFGDVLKAGTHAMGIEACRPCEKRAQWLNKRFPL